MNRLEIFKQVKEHMLTQNAKALDEGGECVYLSDTGLKCAVGCLIKPKHYDEKMEGCSASQLLHPPKYNRKGYKELKDSLEKTLNTELNQNIVSMLGELQRIHDELEVSEWETELNYLEQEIINDD